MEILLLTASINAKLASPIYTHLTDTEERLAQYKNTLKRYIEDSSFDKLVFCENTGFNFSKDYLIDLAIKNNKQIEFLTFISDIKAVNKYGKGYGEGECLKYAIENSEFINNNKVFYKVTGRLFVENINLIIKKHSNINNCFYTDGWNSTSVNTFFFKCDASFFKTYLENSYLEVNDSQGRFLEFIYFDILIKQRIRSFRCLPFISGNSGSTGNAYTVESEYRIKKIYNFFGFYSLNIGIYKILRILKKIKSIMFNSKRL